MKRNSSNDHIKSEPVETIPSDEQPPPLSSRIIKEELEEGGVLWKQEDMEPCAENFFKEIFNADEIDEEDLECLHIACDRLGAKKLADLKYLTAEDFIDFEITVVLARKVVALLSEKRPEPTPTPVIPPLLPPASAPFTPPQPLPPSAPFTPPELLPSGVPFTPPQPLPPSAPFTPPKLTPSGVPFTPPQPLPPSIAVTPPQLSPASFPFTPLLPLPPQIPKTPPQHPRFGFPLPTPQPSPSSLPFTPSQPSAPSFLFNTPQPSPRGNLFTLVAGKQVFSTEINWKQVGQENLLNRTVRLGPKESELICSIICKQLVRRNNGQNLPFADWAKVAGAMGRKYPLHFLDNLVKEFCTKRLICYGAYMSQQLRKEGGPRSNKSSCATKQNSAPQVSAVTSEERRKMMQMQMAAAKNRETLMALMEKCFVPLRKDLNECKSIPFLRTYWPFLFDRQVASAHFQRRTGVAGFRAVFHFAFRKAEMTLNFLKADAREVFSNVIIRQENAARLKWTTLTGSDQFTPECKLLMVLEALPIYFGEHVMDQVIYVKKIDFDAKLDWIEVSTRRPILIAKGDSLITAKSFLIVVENYVVFETVEPCQALELFFSSYFIFNATYMPGCCKFMLFLQRYVFGIVPPEGGASKNIEFWDYGMDKIGKEDVSPCVIKMIAKLNEFDKVTGKIHLSQITKAI